jgi:hypothetical protein
MTSDVAFNCEPEHAMGLRIVNRCRGRGNTSCYLYYTSRIVLVTLQFDEMLFTLIGE